MSGPPLPRDLRRRPGWLLPAFAALLLLPTPWLTAGALLLIALRLVVLVRRRSAAAARRAASAATGAGVALGTAPGGRSVTLSDAELGAHGLILGASGAGKTTTLLRILSGQMERGRAVVAIDLKGSPSFARELQAAALRSGRPFHCWTPDGPASWNPLAAGNATELKDKLILTERFTEPHYQRAAERYVQTVIQVLQASHPDRPVTLARVGALFEPARLAAAARALPPERRDQVRDYLAGLTGDQLSAVRGLANRLAVISESHTGAFLGDRAPGPPIDLAAALERGEVVLFSLNSSTYGQLASQLGTLAVQDLVTVAGRRLSQEVTRPAVVAIDEFSALGTDNVIALLARGREAGLSVLLATQELADLDRAGRGLRDQVLGNTGVKIAHRQDVPASAEAVARLGGTTQAWERSYSVRPGRWGGQDVRGGQLRLVDRYVVEPDRVRSLKTGEVVVIAKTPSSRTSLAQVHRPSGRGGLER